MGTNNKEVFDFVKPNNNDNFSSMNNNDLKVLLNLINSYYLEYRKTLGFDSSVTFGMEIEFEQAILKKIKSELKRNNLDDLWNMELEVTVVETDGAEVVSPVVRDKPKTWNDLKSVCNILKKYATIGENSGGHIHIGAQVLGDKEQSWLNFMKLWTVYENIIYRFTNGEFLISRPTAYEFADPIRDMLWKFYKELSKTNWTFDPDFFKKIRIFNESCAINFKDVKKVNEYELYNTIEFRCPNGTLEPIIWQNNVNLFVKMLEYAKKSNFNDDIVEKRYRSNRDVVDLLYSYKYVDLFCEYEKIYLEQTLEFCDLVFDNNIDKIYFLRQYLKSFQVKKEEEREFTKAKRFIKK